MEDLNRAATQNTPFVALEYKFNKLTFSGESYPENVADFYGPILSWIENFLDAGEKRSISVDLNMIMFNSSSGKVFMDIFDILNEAAPNELSIELNYKYHQDNDILEMWGEDLQEDYPNLKVNTVITE